MPEQLPQAARNRFTRLQQAQADAAAVAAIARGAEPEELSAQGPPHAPSAPKGIHHLQASDPAPMAEIRCRSRLPLVELPEKLA